MERVVKDAECVLLVGKIKNGRGPENLLDGDEVGKSLHLTPSHL